MADKTQWNRWLALLGIRLIVGLLSAQLAIHKIFIEGLDAQMRWFEVLDAWLPWWLLWATNIYAAAVELCGGALLVVGFKRDWALWAILSVLVIVCFGHGLEAAVWDIQQLVFRLAMVVTLLILPAEWDWLRLDNLAAMRRTPSSGPEAR
ncbi:MAG: hypothetical protein H6978_03985 [Gammaproteobacteria bacterium]|nr:hypothetical protein [Gammaproteobacteria bacterium]